MTRAALLFDLDGTLVDSVGGIAAALSAVAVARGGRPCAAAQLRPLVSLGVGELVRRGLGEFAGDPDSDVAAFRAVLRDLPPDRAAIYPGVTEALTAFAAAGHPMALVTNKPEALSFALLDGLGLSRFFTSVVGGDTAAAAKPDPAPLQLALTRLGAAAGEAVMIGDSAVDAEAARRCGVDFILFTGGYGGSDCAPADIRAHFDSFVELPRLVTMLRLRDRSHGPSCARTNGFAPAKGMRNGDVDQAIPDPFGRSPARTSRMKTAE